KGGYDYAKRQQGRQPNRQLVGRNELDDGSGSDRAGPCVAIRLVTRTRHFVVRQCGKLHDALLNSRDPLLPIRIREDHVDVLVSGGNPQAVDGIAPSLSPFLTPTCSRATPASSRVTGSRR